MPDVIALKHRGRHGSWPKEELMKRCFGQLMLALVWFATLVLANGFLSAAEIGPHIVDLRKLDSCRIRLDPQHVISIAELEISYGDFLIQLGRSVLVPIGCDRGVTGVVIIGQGSFSYRTANDQPPFSDGFHAAMLRFNPEEYENIVNLQGVKPEKDVGAVELAEHVLNDIFHHCWWHRDMEAFIPLKQCLSAVFYSKKHGDLLISDTISDVGRKRIVYSYTEKRQILMSVTKK